jgi:tetratricopeptide (TPR) repeat protein
MRTQVAKPLIRVTRWTVIGILIAGLAGCAATFDPAGYSGQIDAAVGGTKASDNAMAALAKGDYTRAEQLATAALKGDPKSPYAAYVLAEVYQNTGRPELARKQYEALVSMNAQQTVVVGIGDSSRRVPLAEVARVRLEALAPATPAAMAANATVSVDEHGAGPEGAIIRRFKTLQRLLDEGLITREEYDARRTPNLGALLPYVAPPPAVDLDVVAPSPSEVVDRMKALVAAYQGRSISAVQQQTERTIILDALLPGPGAKRADPPKPITGPVQAAEMVGRLTRFREAGVISADEADKARKVVMSALESYEAKLAAQKRAAEAGGSGPTGVGIRLATYGSEDKALQAWAALQKQFPDQLASLKPVVTRVKLRRGGSVWRLNAGPVADRKAAQAICRAIERHRQTCTPTILK